MTTKERTSGLLNVSDLGVIKLVTRAGAAIAASALMLLMVGTLLAAVVGQQFGGFGPRAAAPLVHVDGA